MQTKKRILSLVLVMAMVLTMIPATAQADFTKADITLENFVVMVNDGYEAWKPVERGMLHYYTNKGTFTVQEKDKAVSPSGVLEMLDDYEYNSAYGTYKLTPVLNIPGVIHSAFVYYKIICYYNDGMSESIYYTGPVQLTPVSNGRSVDIDLLAGVNEIYNKYGNHDSYQWATIIPYIYLNTFAGIEIKTQVTLNAVSAPGSNLYTFTASVFEDVSPGTALGIATAGTPIEFCLPDGTIAHGFLDATGAARVTWQMPDGFESDASTNWSASFPGYIDGFGNVIYKGSSAAQNFDAAYVKEPTWIQSGSVNPGWPVQPGDSVTVWATVDTGSGSIGAGQPVLFKIMKDGNYLTSSFLGYTQSDGTATLNVMAPSIPGDYQVYAYYPGSGKYESVEQDIGGFNVESDPAQEQKGTSNINSLTVPASPLYVGETVEFTAQIGIEPIPGNPQHIPLEGRLVMFRLPDGQTAFGITDNDGNATVSWTVTQRDNYYSVFAVLMETEYYYGSYSEGSPISVDDVSKTDTTVDLKEKDGRKIANTGDTLVYEATVMAGVVPVGPGGTVRFDMPDGTVIYGVTDEDGVARVSWLVPADRYNTSGYVTATYIGSDVYNGNTDAKELKIEKIGTVIEIDPIASPLFSGTTYKFTAKITETLAPSKPVPEGGRVEFVFPDGTTANTSTDTNGVATASWRVPMDTEGLLTGITVRYAGDSRYGSSAKDAEVTLAAYQKKGTLLALIGPDAVSEGDTVQYTATVTDTIPGDPDPLPGVPVPAGGQVVFTMPNGEVKIGYTDIEGIATVSWTVPTGISAADKDGYNTAVSAVYNGATKYQKSNNSLAVTVNSRTISSVGAGITVYDTSTGVDVAVPLEAVETATLYDLEVGPVVDAFGDLLIFDTHYTIQWYKSVDNGAHWTAITDEIGERHENAKFDTDKTMYKARVTPKGSYRFGEFELVVAATKLREIDAVELTVAALGGGDIREGKGAILTANVWINSDKEIPATGGSVKFYENGTLIGEANVVDDGTAVLTLGDYLLDHTLREGVNTYTAKYSGVPGVYAEAIGGTADDGKTTVLTGTIPSGWTITKKNANTINDELEAADIGREITLTVNKPADFTVKIENEDYEVKWYMSEDGGQSWELMQQSGPDEDIIPNQNIIKAKPLNNQYRYQAVIFPSDAGDYYRPINGVTVAPIAFEGALNATRVIMQTPTATPFEFTKMPIYVTVMDTLNTAGLLDDVPVRSGFITLSVSRNGEGYTEIATLNVDSAGMATFNVDVPEFGAIYTYMAEYTDNDRIYEDNESTEMTYMSVATPPSNGDVTPLSNTIVWKTDLDAIIIHEGLNAPGGAVADSMENGKPYTLEAPDVYTRAILSDDPAAVSEVPLTEDIDFYYEWMISEDSGNTWTTKGNHGKYLTDVVGDDDTLYKVRAIPTGDYVRPTGGLESEPTGKSDRIESKVAVTIGNSTDANVDAYEANPVTIKAQIVPEIPVDEDDRIADPTGEVRFYYYELGKDDTTTANLANLSNWMPIVADSGGSGSKPNAVQVQGSDGNYFAEITTSTLPVYKDGTYQNLIFRADYAGDDVYAPASNTAEGSPATIVDFAMLTLWSSVPYVDLTTEDLVTNNPKGIVITAPESQLDPDTGDLAVTDDGGNLTVVDAGTVYSDGTYYKLTLTTPIVTRDGFKPVAGNDFLKQMGGVDTRRSITELGDDFAKAILDADTNYSIYWEYCANYNENLVTVNADGVIGGQIDSAAGDNNTWLAVGGNTNWHTIFVSSQFASYAFRARIEVKDTEATKAAISGVDAVALYGNETTKSAARTTYYSNVILVKSGEEAATNGFEAVISPASSGAAEGDTIIIDAFAYGGSASGNPQGTVELYVDMFEADEWVKIDQLDDMSFNNVDSDGAATNRDDDYQKALVNGEAAWYLANMVPGVYSFKLVFTSADESYSSEKYIYNYIVRDDSYRIELEQVVETYDGEMHFALVNVYDNDTLQLPGGQWVWNFYEYTAGSDEYVDLVWLIIDNISYTYYASADGEDYADTPSITAPIDFGYYKVEAQLLDTAYLTRRSANSEELANGAAVLVQKRPVYLEQVTFQDEVYDPTNIENRALNVLYTDLNQAAVSPEVSAGTGFSQYGTNNVPMSLDAERDFGIANGFSASGEGLPSRAFLDTTTGVVAGDTVRAQVVGANVQVGNYKAGEDRDTAVTVKLAGADAANYRLVQKGSYAAGMTDEETETYLDFPITIHRNQLYAGWLTTAQDGFAVIDESGTAQPDMEVEYYYHGEGKIALVASGKWNKTTKFSALTEADNWDDETGKSLVPKDLTKPGLYTVVVRPADDENYKGGASTKMIVTVDNKGKAIRTYEKTVDELASPTLMDIGSVLHYFDDQYKGVSVSFTNPAYTATDATIKYYFDGAITTETDQVGRYGVTISVPDKNIIDEVYAAAGILTIYRGPTYYDTPAVGDKTYDGTPVTVTNVDSFPDGTYFTYAGGTIKGISYEAPIDAGDYVVSAHIPNQHNYAEVITTGTFTINKATIKAQISNVYSERFTTVAMADVKWLEGWVNEAFAYRDSSFNDILILPSFRQYKTSSDMTHVGTYNVTAVPINMGSEGRDLGTLYAYSNNYIIETVNGTNTVTATNTMVPFQILGLADHGTVHYGDTIDLWTVGDTGRLWTNQGSVNNENESAIIRWDVIIDDDFVGKIYIDALTGELYVDGVGEFTVYAFRGVGTEMIYTSITACAEKREAIVVLDQDDHIYDGTVKSYTTSRIHIGILDEVAANINTLTDIGVTNTFGRNSAPNVSATAPNPEITARQVALFTAGTPTAAVSYETTGDRIDVGTYVVRADVIANDYYAGFGYNRMTIHESYKDVVVDTGLSVSYGDSYDVDDAGKNYTHTVGTTLNTLAGLTPSGSEELPLVDARVFASIGRRSDAGAYTAFVAGGTESNLAGYATPNPTDYAGYPRGTVSKEYDGSNYIYRYVDGIITVDAYEDEAIITGFNTVDGENFTTSKQRVYGEDSYVLDYSLANLVDGDSLADFDLEPNFIYAATPAAVTEGTGGIYTRTGGVAQGGIMLDSTVYTGVSGLILSNPVNHAQRADGDIYTVEANDAGGAYGTAIAKNHYGEAGIAEYEIVARAKNSGAENYVTDDAYVKYEAAALEVTQRAVALKGADVSIPIAMDAAEAYNIIIKALAIDDDNTDSLGLAYGHDVADLELAFWIDFNGNGDIDGADMLLEKYLEDWYADKNGALADSYKLVPVVRNTNYNLIGFGDIEVEITLERVWGKVTWYAGNNPVNNKSTYTDSFQVEFYAYVYDLGTHKWEKTETRVRIAAGTTVSYTVNKYIDGVSQDGEVLATGNLSAPTGASYVYRSATFSPRVTVKAQVFLEATGYNFVSVS